MPTNPNVVKGFIKTENAILLILVGVAVGFIAGVVFSAYRGASQMPMTAGAQSAPISPEQAKTLAALVQRTEENPKDIDAWTHLGHLYFDVGQPKEAIAAYESALTLDDSRPDVWTDLGVMYRSDGQPKKAIESFERALKLNPTHEIATFNIGVVRMHDLQDPQGALQAWEKLLAINPEAKTPGGQMVRDMVAELKKHSAAEKEPQKP
jgi:cytochrome c-type biogenesis protein CcmH/NrfG